MPHTKKSPLIATAKNIKQRQMLEILLDTCSMGPEQIAAVERLIEHTRETCPPVFKNYRIIIPVQIATEIKQRVFPEFLKAELQLARAPLHDAPAPSPSALRKFYKTHATKIEVVETDVSVIYKMTYMKKALAYLAENPDAIAPVLAHATALAARYEKIPECKTPQPPQKSDFESLCSKFLQQQKNQKQSQELSMRRINQHLKAHTEQSPAETLFNQAHFKNAARNGTRFLESLSMPERYCLQALYSEPVLYKAVTQNTVFKEIRRDQGERAIESYLFQQRRKTDASVASLVISNDTRACESIKSLRQQSQNTVLAINHKELQNALNILDGRTKPCDIAHNAAETAHKKNARQAWLEHPDNHRRDKLQREQKLPPNPPANPKWERRLAEFMQTGQWQRTPRPAAKNFTDRISNNLPNGPSML